MYVPKTSDDSHTPPHLNRTTAPGTVTPFAAASRASLDDAKYTFARPVNRSPSITKMILSVAGIHGFNGIAMIKNQIQR